MARFRFSNRITANSDNPEMRLMQQQFQDLIAALNISLNDLDSENIAPEFLDRIVNEEKAPIETVKNKEANVYMGNDGLIYKILK